MTFTAQQQYTRAAAARAHAALMGAGSTRVEEDWIRAAAAYAATDAGRAQFTAEAEAAERCGDLSTASMLRDVLALSAPVLVR